MAVFLNSIFIFSSSIFRANNVEKLANIYFKHKKEKITSNFVKITCNGKHSKDIV